MDRLSLLGLQPSDLPDPVSSDEQIIHEVCTSGRLYRIAMGHIILERLRGYFDDRNLQLQDRLDVLFPIKKRRSRWNAFQMTFDFDIPNLGWSIGIQIFMITYVVIVILIFIWLAPFHLKFPILKAFRSGGKALAMVFFLALAPMAFVAYVGNLRLPGRVVGDLIDEIISVNTKSMLSNDCAELQAILREQLSRGNPQIRIDS